jgi:antitoxin component YwqK of YwqJK toxin-antitoxin module
MKHGYWEGYHRNGQLEYKGNYLNDEEIGLWIHYNITEFHL